MSLIYKVCGMAEWAAAETLGRYEGSEDDKRDGYIHFSTVAQLGGTLAKHFARRSDLLLIAVETDKLADALKWEPSRGGALFPHLYATLSIAAISWARPLPLDAAGVHQLPPEARP